MLDANTLTKEIGNALRKGLSDPESDTRYAMIDVLTLISNPHDFDDVIDIITGRLYQGLYNKNTITETLYVINFLLGTHYTVTDFIHEGG